MTTDNACAGEVGLARIESHLDRREKLFKMKIGAMFGFGIPLSLVGPFVLATIFWFVLWRLRVSWAPSWMSLFVVLTICVVPLLYHLEIRTRGNYLQEALTGGALPVPHGRWMVPGIGGSVAGVTTVAASPRLGAAGFVELFLAGPRMILGAYRRRRFRRQLGDVDKHRCAVVVSALLACDAAIETERLLGKGETFEDLHPTLAYLLFHQWIAVGKGWERVWLYSESRQTFRKPPGAGW